MTGQRCPMLVEAAIISRVDSAGTLPGGQSNGLSSLEASPVDPQPIASASWFSRDGLLHHSYGHEAWPSVRIALDRRDEIL